MEKQIIIHELTVKKAEHIDWNSILDILNETGLSFWLAENEKYDSFYIVNEIETNNSIACFAINKENDIGILKSFGIRKDKQGKGIGKNIINNEIPKLARELKLKKLYLLADNKEPFTSYSFWKKTIFLEKSFNDKFEDFFKIYINEDERLHPDFAKTRSPFCLHLKREENAK